MSAIHAAEFVVPCADLQATLSFFTERLGFLLESIFPADHPAVAVLRGHGVRLRLDRGHRGDPGVLRLQCADATQVGGGELELVAPNGTRVVLVNASPPRITPPSDATLIVNRFGATPRWSHGRAGMLYRDLLPDRLGGFLIASHIRIEAGGPVNDSVHFHEVAFQLIYCHRGWVRVVYEDQGPPFVMTAGDCVLQPPRIRHRVLECSAGLEVIELSAPAEHETRMDHELALPSAQVIPGRDFAGQRFVRRECAAATWEPWRVEGFEARDLGIEAATRGFARIRVARPAVLRTAAPAVHAAFRFAVVLSGTTTLTCEGRASEKLLEGDSVLLPGDVTHTFSSPSLDLQLLEAEFPRSPAPAQTPVAR